MAENVPSIAVISEDKLSVKGDAVKVIMPNAAAVSAVNEMRSLRMCDSTSVGCRKSTELPKDRFTRYRKQALVGQWNIGDSLWIKSQISASDGCSVTPRITPM